MRTFRLPTALLAVGLSVCLGAPLAVAQTAFVLDDPILVADGRRVPVEGAPLRQDRFGTLVLTVPGVGIYTIADAPFEGARRAGEFDGDALVFASEGVSVRLRGRETLLSENRRPAYVRTQPNALRGGLARVQLGGIMAADATRPVRQRSPTHRPRGEDPEPLQADVIRLRREVARLAAEREEAARLLNRTHGTLQSDLDRVTRERDALRVQRNQAIEERAGLAEAMEQARRQAEVARERLASRDGISEREREEARRLEAELDGLRRAVVSRDASIAALTAERDDRSERVAQLQEQVGRLTASLADRTRERDDARRQRDEAVAQLAEASPRSGAEISRLSAEVDRLGASLAETRAERDRLAQLTSVQAPELEAHEGEMDRLIREMEVARGRIDAFETELAVSETARLALESELAETRNAGSADGIAQAEREAWEAERTRLRVQVDALTAEVERLRQIDPPSTPPLPPSSVITSVDTAARVILPGFDFGRLQNPDDVRRRLDTAPVSGRSGEVLVLFQTDASGRVIRTAVPRPAGGDLDGRAEQLVRDMVFQPLRVDGIATGLRSQVLVRFGTES